MAGAADRRVFVVLTAAEAAALVGSGAGLALGAAGHGALAKIRTALEGPAAAALDDDGPWRDEAGGIHA